MEDTLYLLIQLQGWLNSNPAQLSYAVKEWSLLELLILDKAGSISQLILLESAAIMKDI